MDRNTLIYEIMHENVVTLEPESTIASAWELLCLNHIGGAPVVSKSGELKGVLSQSDILREFYIEAPELLPPSDFCGELEGFLADNYALPIEELQKVQVGDLMSKEVFTLKPDDTVGTAACVMNNNKIHRVIISEKDKIVGIITTFDLLKMLCDDD